MRSLGRKREGFGKCKMDQKNLPNQCLWILRFQVSEPRCACVESAVSAKARAYSPLAAFGLASIHSDWSSALAI